MGGQPRRDILPWWLTSFARESSEKILKSKNYKWGLGQPKIAIISIQKSLGNFENLFGNDT